MKQSLMLMMVLCSGLLSAKIVPADGLWRTFDDPQIGSGLMLATEGGITLVSVFTYDADGNNVWYIASGQVDDEGLFSANLLQTGQGEYLLNENPQSAQVISAESTISIQFNGSQVATLSIDDSEPKSIKADYFGFDTDSGLLRLTGKWVLGDVVGGQSFILDLIPTGSGVIGGLPYRLRNYQNIHPSGFGISCRATIDLREYLGCTVSGWYSGSNLIINPTDIGGKTMTMFSDNPDRPVKIQAFRLNKDRRLLPSDGHWRTYDDPAVGSGVVMRTQGDDTVVLLYSYDADGNARWQIASGQFDETGKLVAELNSTQGGTAINQPNPQTAVIGTERSVIEIQMQGSELASLKIGDAEPKSIQHFIFGTELFSTEQFQVMNQAYQFPNQDGLWVAVDNDLTVSTAVKLDYYNPNGLITPAIEWYSAARGYVGNYSYWGWESVFIEFICTTEIGDVGSMNVQLTPYCAGYLPVDQGQQTAAKIYFEDIGYHGFRYYYGLDNDLDVNNVNRQSDYFQFYRLSSD